MSAAPWLTLLALLSSGCLFVGDVNKVPRIGASAAVHSSSRGQPIQIEFDIYDDQPQLEIKPRVLDADGVVVSDPCALEVTPLSTDGPAHYYSILLWNAGAYTIDATVTDPYGASTDSPAVELLIQDEPPTFNKPTMQLRAGMARINCTNVFPGGVPILITLDEGVDDPEQHWAPLPPGCAAALPAPLAFTWHLVDRPAGSQGTLGRAFNGACPATPDDPAIDLPDDDTIVCLYTDAALPTASPSMYSVALDVSDGANPPINSTLTLPVVGNAPACLDGTYPEIGHYVLDRDTPSIFQTVGIDDVSDAATLAFVWSVERAGETSFVALDAPVAAADGGARLIFDPVALGFSVGDQLQLRVEVSDPNSPATACDPSDDSCLAASCVAATSTTCPRRATWSLEIR
jgi:hypothetical protein